MTDSSNSPSVVVGVDGSPSSVEALRWSMRYAKLVAAELHVVSAWENPLPGFAFGLSIASDFERDTIRKLDATMTKVFGEDSPVGVSKAVVRGHPEPILIEASRTADLLVIGDRGRGGFASLLLGSVSESCARGAHCSVIIVRAASSKHA